MRMEDDPVRGTVKGRSSGLSALPVTSSFTNGLLFSSRRRIRCTFTNDLQPVTSDGHQLSAMLVNGLFELHHIQWRRSSSSGVNQQNTF